MNVIDDMIITSESGTRNGKPLYQRYNLDKGTIAGFDVRAQ